MDPNRTPLSPGRGKRRRGSSSNEALPMIPSAHHQPQQQTTSLPPIRQLHPYLPPSSSSGAQHPNENVPYPYPGHAIYASHHPSGEPGPMHAMGGVQRAHQYSLNESEVEDAENSGPPKKKRRRQALSCTECKRRKIKCDRTHPCTPCTRRGEEAGCQWHIVEPVDKYVTKAEFDELKMRHDQLENTIRRYLPFMNSPTAHVNTYYPPLPPALGESVPISYATGPPTNMGYPPAMTAPPHSQPYPQPSDPSQQAHASRHSKADPPSQSPMRSGSNSAGMAAPTPSRPIYQPGITLIAANHRQVICVFFIFHHVAVSTRPFTAAKKLPRADAHSGRVSAPQFRRPIDNPGHGGPPSDFNAPSHSQMYAEHLSTSASTTITPSSYPIPSGESPAPQRPHDPSNRTMGGPGSSGRDAERDRAITGPRGSRDR